MNYRQIELHVGETLTVRCVEDDGSVLGSCSKCCLSTYECRIMNCSGIFRRDGKSVHFEEVKEDDKNL